VTIFADKERLLRSTMLAGVAALTMGAQPVFAQDVEQVPDAQEEEEDEVADRIVVTGSRIARNTFSSPSPLQVVDTDTARDAGIIDAAAIVQNTSVASGTQFDNTFTGQVTDSGPGASTVSLRGLDAERTLILLNGRRIGPAGVRGAPTRPDLNLIPTGMVERFDILTDGASSVYGSDAVAGVINAIMRTEFDGLEIDTFYSHPEMGGGEERRVAITGGVNNDRGFIGFGFEYYNRDEVRREERPTMAPCTRDIEINPTTGEINQLCANFAFGNQFLDPLQVFFGPVLDAGLGSNFDIIAFDFDNGSGFFNYPTEDQPGGPGTDIGQTWAYDPRYNNNSGQGEFDLVQGTNRYSFFTNGEYAIDMLGDAEVYFEALHSGRSQEIFAGRNQIFPAIQCDNPFIQDTPILANAGSCTQPFRGILEGAGLGGLVWVPIIDNISGAINVDVTTTRVVGGLRGNMDFVSGEFGGESFGLNLGNWTYDFWASADRNVGVDTQQTLGEERTYAALNRVTEVAPGEYTCESTPGDLFGYISDEECVPLDITDPNIYINGDLPQEFLDYAAGLAVTRTTIQQSMFQATFAGDFAYLPAGTVPLVFGFEYRKDEIYTENSFLISTGAGSGRNETNTFGNTSTKEFFIETEIPVLAGQPFAEELTFTAAARYTDEENFGSLWTYRAQGMYRPTDWLTLRSTWGTTFRAPNLREQFLGGQISFGSAFADPCVASTFNGLDVADQARVRNNCALQGADVDNLGLGGATSIPIASGGFADLDAETSESISAGIVFEQPWYDSFDFRFAVNYFNIEIEDSIEEPTLGLILNACLIESTDLNSPFCNLIERNTSSDPTRNFISQINSGFVNVGLIETDGVDFNIGFNTDFTLFGSQADLSFNGVATYIASNRRDIFADQDTAPAESFRGEYGYPLWQGNWTTRLDWRDLSATWTGRYIGEWSDDDIDPIRTQDFADQTTGFVYFAAGFRDVEEADAKIYHDLSVSYDMDVWNFVVGARNVFDERPPLVDSGEGIPETANNVIGMGYDIYGRTWFTGVRRSF